MIGEGAPCCCDGGGAGATDERMGEVADGGHKLRRVARAQGGAILAEGDVAHPVAALDGPVPAYQREQARGRGLPRRATGEHEADLALRAAAVLRGGEQAGDLPDVEAVRAYPGDEGWLRDRLQTILRTALEPRGRL